MVNDPSLFYKQIIRSNNVEVDFSGKAGAPPNQQKPLKIVNVITVNGNFGANCKGACAEMTNRLLKKIAVQQKYKLNKIQQDFNKCPQKGKVNVWNLGTNKNINLCSEESNGHPVTPSIEVQKVEEMIPESECNVIWDYS